MKKPARGLRSDGEATRTRILEAAGEMFATTGYAETPNKAIAAHARVDLASINYHFGNRSGLYQAVLTESYGQVLGIADLRQLVGSELSPASKLRALIEQLVGHATREPQAWQLRVLAREVLAPTSHLQTLFRDEALPKVALLRRLLSEVTRIPAEDPALTRCLLCVIAPCLMLLVGGRAFPGPLREVFQMPSQTIASHLHHYATGGLKAISREYAKQAKTLGKRGSPTTK
ncbi:MAG: TetR/AcrR family transcriptional regulator [Steroidobacteraceae bacterium]